MDKSEKQYKFFYTFVNLIYNQLKNNTCKNNYYRIKKRKKFYMIIIK